MNFRRINHFVQVAELGSLSKAADRLSIVQPALSKSIKLLEEDLGVSLFVRSRKGMALTEAGQLFLESAYGILNQYSRAKENISAIGDSPQGLVSVAMTASALHVLTVPLCRLIDSNYPNIDINLEEGLAGNIRQGFEAGQYDLVISHMVPTGEGISSEGLIEEELFLTSQYDKKLPQSDITFRKLIDYPLIVPQDRQDVRGTVEQIAKAQGAPISLRSVTAALHPTIELVQAGHGHSLLPWAAIHDRVQRKKLSTRKVVRPRINHTVAMIYPANRPLTQAAIVVMEMIRLAARECHESGIWRGKLLLGERS